MLYDRFLERYCQEMRFVPNEEDQRIINCFQKANIRRSQDLQRKDKYSWQSRLEKIDLQTFSKSWLSENKKL
jgi:hypothetical protein